MGKDGELHPLDLFFESEGTIKRIRLMLSANRIIMNAGEKPKSRTIADASEENLLLEMYAKSERNQRNRLSGYLAWFNVNCRVENEVHES